MVLLFRRAKSHPPKTPFFLFGGLKVHGTLKAAYYDAFRAARQEINAGVAGMEIEYMM